MIDYLPHLDTITRHNLSDLALLNRWSAISSGTYHIPGLRAMADELEAAFSPLGQVTRHNLPPAPLVDSLGNITAASLGQALSIIVRPDAALRVLLMIHYDTVYTPDDPFRAVTIQSDGNWNGPGVVDAKGGIIVMLAALRALEASPFAKDIGWEVLLNPDEEIGSPGSAKLIAEAAGRNHLALLFEPALPDGSLVGARKGSGNFTVVVRGKAAHAGRDFAAGRSAILALAELIQQADSEARTIGGGVTLNCGQISGGGAVNIVPDLAIARFNARAADDAEAKAVEQMLGRLLAAFNTRDGITASLHGSFASPPKPLDPASLALLNRLADCGRVLGGNLSGEFSEEFSRDLTWRSSGGTCDGNRLAAAGLPVVDTLGPVGGDLHSPREYLVPSTIAQRAKLTALLLMRMAREGFADVADRNS